ncbi:MAG: ORF6N domain-containing protein, partial [Bacteroidales bacterium]|nr:ORF6N domain-containing protein [Bacteroidales bacterium]
MTKKKTKKEEKPSILLEVAHCDQFTEVVTKCDYLENNDKILSQSEIESLILAIRGQQVMIDRDLANLYKVKTKRLNEQVKRNIEKFPLDFCFQLNDFEFEKWRSQFATSNSDKMGVRRAPYAFTEQGVAMLASVLKSETAIVASVKIM